MNRIRTRQRSGFTLIEIMIVVAIIGLLGAMAIPHAAKARRTSQTNACINNLRQIDNAKQQFALEFGQSGGVPNNNQIMPYLGRGTAGYLDNVYCPLAAPKAALAGYDVKPIGQVPDCLNFSGDHPAILQ